MIVQINDHLILDSKSSIILFNKLCEIYNCLSTNNKTKLQIIEENLRSMTQIGSYTLVDLILKSKSK